ncbi:MAG: sulfotransferase [Desulfococcaceae bacterium]
MTKNIRYRLRSLFFQFLSHVSDIDDSRQIAVSMFRGLLSNVPPLDYNISDCPDLPYPEVGKISSGEAQGENRAVFITGRFRSGSTLLWNIFRNISGCTSYYEPLNERRWFDPAGRGSRVDSTHLNVSDYWREYEGMSELGQYHRTDWTYRNLYMDAMFWAPEMKEYINILIQKSSGIPVLQFNRVDFRLAWLKKNYPFAKIIHIFRHPRDQWCSSLRNPDAFSSEGTVRDFVAYDRFYLLPWARDLKYHFPFLNEKYISHPYRLFYFIWKLSYISASRYADYSVCFENLGQKPEKEIPKLLDAAGIGNPDIAKLAALVKMPKPGKWKSYADNDWFALHEHFCEKLLSDYFAG